VAGIAAPEEQPNADARLESIYQLHAARVRARCLGLTGNPLAAEDLMQEVFARFLARFRQLPAGTNVEGYLLATARNIWINQARKERRHPLDELDHARTSDDRLEHDPVRSLLLGEQRALVRESARELTGRQRRALAMRELDGRSYAEIGNDLGIGTNAVAQVLWRARGQLRRALRRSQVDVEQLPAECRAMLDDMSDLADRTPSSGQAELEAHIEDCTTCRRTLASYQEAGAGLRGAMPFLPLLAMMGRAATALRASVEAASGIGTAAAVTATVVATVGGGGAIVSHYAASSSSAVPTSTRLLRESPRPSGRANVVALAPTVSLVVHRTDTTARRPSAAHPRTTAGSKAPPQRRRERAPTRVPITVTEHPARPAAPVRHEVAPLEAAPPVTTPTRRVHATTPAKQRKTPPGKAQHAGAKVKPDKARPEKVKPEHVKAVKADTHDAPVPASTSPPAQAHAAKNHPDKVASHGTKEIPAAPPAAVPGASDPVQAPAPSEHGNKAEAAPAEPIVIAPPADPPAGAPAPPDTPPGASNGGGNGKSEASSKHS
jgi:RNA polymerase sigma factor (sigma-70 family)